MATRTLFQDDFTGDFVESTEEVHWTVNGQQMTMNLSPDSYAAFQEAMGPWLDASQPAEEKASSEKPKAVSTKVAKLKRVARAPKPVEARKPERPKRTQSTPKVEPLSAIEDLPIVPIPLLVSETTRKPEFLSLKEAADLKRKNHGYTRCDDKLVAKIGQVGSVKIRTNITQTEAAQLQHKVAAFGIQLRFEASSYVRVNGAAESYGVVYASLKA